MNARKINGNKKKTRPSPAKGGFGLLLAGLSLRSGGHGFSPATENGPRLLLLENTRKIEPK